MTLCEQQSFSFSCPSGLIQIINTYYGRNQDKTTCASGQPGMQCCSNACSFFDQTSMISNQCNSKTTCFISASNGLFGDACHGYGKYAKITYQCSGKILKYL